MSDPRPQSVKLQLEQLWESVEKLGKQDRQIVNKMTELEQELEGGVPVKDGAINAADLLARIQTIEQMLWGDGK